MFQNLDNGRNFIYKEFQSRLQNIDHIAQLAIQCKQKKITQKYANIQSTAKTLKYLINQFVRKSTKIQKQLRTATHIQDLQYQTQYHRKRVDVCVKSSQNLEKMIASKKQEMERHEVECERMKQQLILVKTQNIKKILKIEMIETLERQKKQRQDRDTRMRAIKQRIHENRQLIQQGLKYTPSVIDLLKQEKRQLSAVLWQKINKKLTVSKTLSQDYQILKQKLLKHEKKSNLFGLTGSLLFKLEQNKQLSNKIGLNIGRKNKSDPKLLIYDVLRQKHSNEIKAQKQQQQQVKVQYQQFMKFTPIQILGLIQLKGGVSYLRKNSEEFFSDVKRQTHFNIAKSKAK